MEKLLPVLESLSHLKASEQRELVHDLAKEGVVAFIDQNQLLVTAKELPEAEAALDRYHEKKLEELIAGHNSTSGMIAFLRKLWPS